MDNSQQICCEPVADGATDTCIRVFPDGVSFGFSGACKDWLFQSSERQTVLLVFLRQLGCCFSKETLDLLHRQRKAIEDSGGKIVLVHMSSRDAAEAIFHKYGLSGVSHVSDPSSALYRAFGLGRARWRQIFHPVALFRAFWTAILQRHGIRYAGGDAFRMPGSFVLKNAKVVSAFLPSHVAEQAAYCELVKAAGPVEPEIPCEDPNCSCRREELH